MRHLDRFRRAIASGVLALSASAAIVLPITHAIAEARTAHPVAHVEQAGSERCAVAHHHGACQLCRITRLVAPPATHGFAFVIESRVAPPVVAVIGVERSLRLFGSHTSQAPPSSSIA
jgi:hypothetical protein